VAQEEIYTPDDVGIDILLGDMVPGPAAFTGSGSATGDSDRRQRPTAAAGHM
jgi:hypothetical protein